jgi:crotonobetainyl-CoA:carnitine CoA-transferase CaiB-like acyl-CoA transferase
MLRATLAFLTEPAAHYFATGEVPGPRTRPRQSQSYGFRAADGRALVIHLSTPQKFWEGLLRAVERPDLATDDRFVDYGARVANYDALHDLLAPVFRLRERADWLAVLAAEDVPSAPVHTLAEVFDDPQVRHLGLAVQLAGSDLPAMRTVERAVRLDGLSPLGRPPSLGEHTDAVLAGVGYDAAAIADLRRQGSV